MKKFLFVFHEMKKLIAAHKLFFLAPLLLRLAVVAILFIKLGSSIIMTFIYAGV